MKIDRTYAIYFSPTYTSKKSAVSIARGLEGELSEIDLTLEETIPEMTFSRHDIVVFGFPVYGGRILHEALERLKSFRGDHTSVSYTHLRAHETGRNLVCRLLLEKKKARK